MSRQNIEYDLLATSPATVFNTGALGTSAILFGAASPATPNASNLVVRRIEITNKSAAAYVAYLPSTADSPAFVASAANIVAATEGIPVFPGTSKVVYISAAIPFWLIASAASTPVQVVAYDRPAR